MPCAVKMPLRASGEAACLSRYDRTPLACAGRA